MLCCCLCLCQLKRGVSWQNHSVRARYVRNTFVRFEFILSHFIEIIIIILLKKNTFLFKIVRLLFVVILVCLNQIINVSNWVAQPLQWYSRAKNMVLSCFFFFALLSHRSCVVVRVRANCSKRTNERTILRERTKDTSFDYHFYALCLFCIIFARCLSRSDVLIFLCI